MGDTDGLGTDRRRMGAGQLVAAVGGGGGAGPPHPDVHHTSQRPGIPASAAFTVLIAAPFAVHPDCDTEIAAFQRAYKTPATEVQEQRWVGDIKRSTPSMQAVLAAGTEPECHHIVQGRPDCAYKRVTLRLVPPDGRWHRAEQLSFIFRLYIHEPDIPRLKVVVGRGVAWKRCNDPPNGSGGRCSEWGG